jgi:carbon monoxide dehydrogenase subunit G
MDLSNEFSVPVPADEAWAVLTDLERVAPCMPGFELQEVDGDEFRGVVKIKVGPMIAQYKGVASFQELDEANHRVVVRAEGREMRGQGSAAATVTATLEPVAGGTRVLMHTDLKITGKVAQFGRGVLADVSSKLLGQFAEALEADVLSSASPAGSKVREASEEPAPTGQARPSDEPVDLLATAGSPVVKRVAPLLLVVAVAILLLRQC